MDSSENENQDFVPLQIGRILLMAPIDPQLDLTLRSPLMAPPPPELVVLLEAGVEDGTGAGADEDYKTRQICEPALE